MNSLKIVVMGLLATTVVIVNAMNECPATPKKSKKTALELYQARLSEQMNELIRDLASISYEERLREQLTPRECDRATYERFASAICADDQKEVFNIVGEMAMGQAVLSDESLIQLIKLADTQGKEFYGAIFKDAQKILSGAYKDIAQN